jgi:hypothetical protein
MIQREGEDYMLRIYLTPSRGALGRWWCKRFSGRVLHKIVRSDALPLHNHPWEWSESTILSGVYEEVRRGRMAGTGIGGRAGWVWEYRRRTLYPGDRNRIDAETFHMIELVTPVVWTYFVMGPRVQPWIFEDGTEGFSDLDGVGVPSSEAL